MAEGDIYEYVLNMSIGGEKLCNVWHFRQEEADGGGPGLAALNEAVNDDIIPLYRACVSNALTFESARVRRVLPTEGGSVNYVTGVVGTVVAAALPPNSVAVISLYGDDGFQKNDRGRFHVSGVINGWANEGCINGDALATLAALGERLKTTIAGATAGIDYIFGLLNKPAGVFQPLSTVRVQTRLKTLRSRTRRVP